MLSIMRFFVWIVVDTVMHTDMGPCLRTCWKLSERKAAAAAATVRSKKWSHTNDFNTKYENDLNCWTEEMYDASIQSYAQDSHKMVECIERDTFQTQDINKRCFSRVFCVCVCLLLLVRIKKKSNWTAQSYIPVNAWTTGSCCRGKLALHYLFNCDMCCVRVFFSFYASLFATQVCAQLSKLNHSIAVLKSFFILLFFFAKRFFFYRFNSWWLFFLLVIVFCCCCCCFFSLRQRFMTMSDLIDFTTFFRHSFFTRQCFFSGWLHSTGQAAPIYWRA